MSQSDNPSFAGFGKFVPGFDFLQNLATQAAGSAAQKIPQLPNLGSWVAPTLNVEELDKRIEELKAVQFWLDQNAMALKATIQALEVQKMTLATLKGMNFNMGDVANAFKLKVSDSLAGSAQRVADKARTFAGFEIPPTSFQTKVDAEQDGGAARMNQEAAGNDTAQPDSSAPAASRAANSASSPEKATGGVVDPMQWWGALTQQFQSIAADAMKEAAKKTALDAGKNIASGLAKDAMKSATDMASGMAKRAVRAVGKRASQSAAKSVRSGARAAAGSVLRSTEAWPIPGASKAVGGSGNSTAAAGTKPPAPRKAASKPASKATRKSSR